MKLEDDENYSEERKIEKSNKKSRNQFNFKEKSENDHHFLPILKTTLSVKRQTSSQSPKIVKTDRQNLNLKVIESSESSEESTLSRNDSCQFLPHIN